MSESFTESLDAPVIEWVDGREVSFPILTLTDLAAWVKALHAFRKSREEKFIPDDAGAMDVFEIRQRIDREPTIGELADSVYTLTGARKCLLLSLRRGGMAETDAAAVVDKIPSRRLVSLAIDVSGLYVKKAAAKTAAKGGKSDPNELEGEESPAVDPVESSPAGEGIGL